MLQAIKNVVEKKRGDIISFTQNLLKISSVQNPPTGSEKESQEFLAGKLRQLGLKIDLFELGEIAGLTDHPAYNPIGMGGPRRDYRGRPDLVGFWKGKGGGQSLILSGHVDTVSPIHIEEWKHDPWGGEIENGKIFGVGAVDNKGPLSSMLMAIDCLRELGVELKGDLIYESVIDEEHGGANGSLATLMRGYTADAIILGEPTDLGVAVANYGCQKIEISFRGRIRHHFEREKSIPPIKLAMSICQAMEDLEQERCEKGNVLLPDKADLPIRIPFLKIGDMEDREKIEDGRMVLWLATRPDESQDMLFQEVRDCLAKLAQGESWLHKSSLQLQCIGRHLEGSSISLTHPLAICLNNTFQEVMGKKPDNIYGTSCDLFIYTKHAQIPGLVFGPGKLSCAHATDEHIEIEDLLNSVKLYAMLILNWCGYEKNGEIK